MPHCPSANHLVALALSVAGSCVAASVAAQDVDCANAATQNEMTYCAEQDWLVQDENLNAAYSAARAVLKRVDADLPQAERGAADYLLQAQRAWITYRDAACNAEGYTMHGGSAEPMVIYGCRARVTAARAQDLWSLAEQY